MKFTEKEREGLLELAKDLNIPMVTQEPQKEIIKLTQADIDFINSLLEDDEFQTLDEFINEGETQTATEAPSQSGSKNNAGQTKK